MFPHPYQATVKPFRLDEHVSPRIDLRNAKAAKKVLYDSTVQIGAMLAGLIVELPPQNSDDGSPSESHQNGGAEEELQPQHSEGGSIVVGTPS